MSAISTLGLTGRRTFAFTEGGLPAEVILWPDWRISRRVCDADGQYDAVTCAAHGAEGAGDLLFDLLASDQIAARRAFHARSGVAGPLH